MKKIAILLILLCADTCFGIDLLKLYRDDIGVVYPEKAKSPLAVSECRPSPELKKDKPKRHPSFDEISVAIVREFEESVAATMKSASESAIPIPSVITGEFILEAGNTYHATTDVTIPANQILRHEGGAVVEWAAGCGLLKEPDGIYIARGKPWVMCVHIPDSNSPSSGYWDGIRLEGGAARDSVSEVTYTYTAYAEKAITLSDITLNRFFENNFFEFNNSGIVSYGPRQTKITNNVCYRGDLSEALNLGQDCFLYGWSDFYHTGFQSEFEQFSSNLWTRFEAGDTFDEAIQYCIDHGEPYEGQNPRVEYRIHGVGDMFNFEL